MIRIIIHTYITRADRSGNRYSVCSVRSTITNRIRWIDYGCGDGTGNISSMVRNALGITHGQTVTGRRAATYKEYKALAEDVLREYQTAECIEAIRALEKGLMPAARHFITEHQKANRIVEAADILSDIGCHFEGPLADMARDFADLCGKAIEESGDWVISANGGNKMRAYTTTGKVGREILARRKALGQIK